MNIAKWDAEIAKVHPDKAKAMIEAIGLLLSWPVFKEEFEGTGIAVVQTLLQIRTNA